MHIFVWMKNTKIMEDIYIYTVYVSVANMKFASLTSQHLYKTLELK